MEPLGCVGEEPLSVVLFAGAVLPRCHEIRVDSVSWTKTDDSCLTISKLLPQALPSSSTTMACIMTPTVSTMASTMRGRAVASRSPASTSSRSTSTITARVTRKTAAPAPKGVRVGKDFNLPNPAKLFMSKSDAKALPTKAKAGTSNKTAARKVTAAQQFSVKIPGKVFQSNNDVVKTVELGFTKANELFVGRCVSPPTPATAATSIAMSISCIRAAHPSTPPPPFTSHHMPVDVTLPQANQLLRDTRHRYVSYASIGLAVCIVTPPRIPPSDPSSSSGPFHHRAPVSTPMSSPHPCHIHRV